MITEFRKYHAVKNIPRFYYVKFMCEYYEIKWTFIDHVLFAKYMYKCMNIFVYKIYTYMYIK